MNYKHYKAPENLKSDGCTLFPDRSDYKHCCLLHDGAIKDPLVKRINADYMFARCMWDNFSVIQKHRPRIFRWLLKPIDKAIVILATLYVTVQGITGIPPILLSVLTVFAAILYSLSKWG